MTDSISSGGLGAILSTMKHANEKAGFFRSSKALLAMNSHGGFDCPGCAWPEPKDRSRFEFCENGAKTLMNATTAKKVDAAFFARHSIKSLLEWSDYQLTNCGRLTVPAIKEPRDTHFRAIDYKTAFALAADHFKVLPHPDRAVFYTSGRASNEAAFLYQLFARLIGTNNLCDCSNLCHESSGVALKKTIGIGKGTVQLEDFEQTDVIFLIGHNPATNHPRMLTSLRKARQNGSKIVVINPLIEPGLKKFRHPQKINDMVGNAKEIATHYVQVKVGSDYALFTAIAHELVVEQRGASVDQKFIRDFTSGYEDFAHALKHLDITSLLADAELRSRDIKTLAQIISSSKRVIYAWGMGITQTTLGVATIEAIVNCALLRGHLGKPGTGLCPVRGHSNVQGNRTVGITEKPSNDFLAKLSHVFKFNPPHHHGLDVVDSIHAMLNHQVDIFMALGGNFFSASPDSERTKTALKNCKVAINIATSLNRTHLVAGQTALLLPCLTRIERDVQNGYEQVISVENSMGIVHASRGNFAPLCKSLQSETAIIAQIAKLSLPHYPHIPWQAFNDNYDLIRDQIALCIDEFKNYNRLLKHKDGFRLKNGAAELRFATPTQKAQFSRPIIATRKLGNHDLLLTTIRSHDQFNTAIYGLDDRYRGVKGERDVVFMNQRDISRLRLNDGMRVDLISRINGKKRTAKNFLVRSFDINVGCAAVYFPEGNVLVPLESVALESNTPTSKFIPIIVKKHANELA